MHHSPILEQLPSSESSTRYLSAQELLKAELYWLRFSEEEYSEEEIYAVTSDQVVCSIFSLHPIMDSGRVLRVSGRF